MSMTMVKIVMMMMMIKVTAMATTMITMLMLIVMAVDVTAVTTMATTGTITAMTMTTRTRRRIHSSFHAERGKPSHFSSLEIALQCCFSETEFTGKRLPAPRNGGNAAPSYRS